MKKVFLILTIFISMAFANEDELKMVVDLTSGDLKRVENYLFKAIPMHKSHYEEQYKSLKVTVVIHGDSYKFFIKDLNKSPYFKDLELKKVQKEFYERLKNLAEFYEVKFEICSIGLRNKNIATDNLYDFAKPIFSATSGLLEWQNLGYAYIPLQ